MISDDSGNWVLALFNFGLLVASLLCVLWFAEHYVDVNTVFEYVNVTVVDKIPDYGTHYVELSDGRMLPVANNSFWYESMIGHEYNVTIAKRCSGKYEITGWSP
jgi:hypothetical protein